MAGATEKIYRSFNKGIITEASPLTFPENASIDEDNFVLNRNGSRARRLGLEYETGYSLTDTGLSSSVIASTKQSIHIWPTPGGDTSRNIGVVRVYNKLYFINLLASSPSANLLNGGAAITISALANSELETAVINNSLVLVSKDLPLPILLTYNSTTDTVTQTQVSISVRDIWGIDDGLLINERPTTLSNAHKYNLRNQGWSTKIVTTSSADAIDKTKTDIGVYPSNGDTWHLGRDTNPGSSTYQAYVPSTLIKNSVSNSLVSRGSYIIDAFTRGAQRAALSGLTGLPVDRENGTFSTVASYASRVFYSGIASNVTGSDSKSPNYSGFVFFSQVVTDNNKIGKCYQEADPTDEFVNDLVDSDGGTIQIPDATNIIRIISSQSSLLVFAENGIWEIYGDTNGFVATSFQVNKISTNGVLNAKAIVETNGSFIYWSKAGIYALASDSVSGRFAAQNISLTSIQSFYLDIPELAKNYCKGFYDEKENRVRWLYNDTDTYSENNYINKYNKELVLDLTLSAFYPHTISSLASNSPYIVDYVPIPGYSVTSNVTDVAVGGDLVEITSLDNVVVNQDVSASRSSQFSFLVFRESSFTLAKYINTSFTDWELAGNGTGATYSSFLVTGYELFGDIMRNKQAPYLFFYFDRTEDGYELSGSNLVLSNQSSCLVQAQWNWSDSANSGKWGNQFQAYRLLRNYIPSGVNDPFDYGDSVIVTKNKLRGSGKALSIYIQSEAGKDMRILGWGIGVTADDKP